MPTNNFKLFDQNKANLLSDTEYANSAQRLNGVQTGVASSQLNNKFAYQVSLVAYAIAQIMNQNGLDASDTLSVSAFVGNLGGALLQKVADRASTAEAAAGALANKYISPATMKAAALLLSGGTMTGPLNMNSNRIINLPTPSSDSEPSTKGYVDKVKSDVLTELDKEVSPLKVNYVLLESFTGNFTSNFFRFKIPFSTYPKEKLDIIAKSKRLKVKIRLYGNIQNGSNKEYSFYLQSDTNSDASLTFFGIKGNVGNFDITKEFYFSNERFIIEYNLSNFDRYHYIFSYIYPISGKFDNCLYYEIYTNLDYNFDINSNLNDSVTRNINVEASLYYTLDGE